MDEVGALETWQALTAVWRPLWGLWLAWLVVAVRVWPRDRLAWGLTLFALALRWVLVEPGAALPYDKAFVLDVEALGVFTPPSLASDRYGDTFPSLSAWVHRLTGHPDTPTWTSWGVSGLATPWAVVLARRGGLSERWAALAGLFVACLPMSVGLSGSTTRFAVAPMLVLAGLAGVSSLDDAATPADRRWQAAWVVLCTALLAHTRPFLVFAAAGLVGALLWRRRWGAVIAGGVALAVRAWPLTGSLGPESRTGAKLDAAWRWWTAPSGWLDGPQFLDGTVTPLVLPGLALVAVVTPWWRGRGMLVGTWLLCTLPYLHYSYDFDLGRMQLASGALLCVLAAHGARVAWEEGEAWGLDRRLLGGLGLGVLVASWWAARHPRGEPQWSFVIEYELLRRGLADCPTDRPLVVGPTFVADTEAHADWFGMRGPWPIVGPDAEVPGGSCRFVGLTAWQDGEPDLTGWSPTTVRTVELSSDGWYDREGERVRIGWYVRDESAGSPP